MSGQAKRKRITTTQRMKVWQKYNGHCAYCGCEITLEEMQVDHMESIYRHEKDYIAGKAEYLDDIKKLYASLPDVQFLQNDIYTGTVQTEIADNDGEIGKTVYI